MNAHTRTPLLLARITLLVALAVGAGPSSAAPCAGFTDVSDTGAFCPNVEWLKNRGVTLGCTSATLYCPNDDVSRLSMALFMNRLGTALTPVNVTSYNQVFNIDIDAAPRVCASVDRTPTYAMTSHGVAVFGGGSPTDPVEFAIEIVESTNSGTSWTPVTPLHAVSVGAGGRRTVSSLLLSRTLNVGTPYRWAIRVTRAPGSATFQDPINWQCQLQIRLDNRNPSTSPFDEDD